MRRILVFVALCACSAREAPPWPPPVELKKPPARPELATSTGDTRWFVVDQFFLGRRFRNGVHDWRAWAEYGYDLDDRATTKEESELSARSCKRRDGSLSAVLVDGAGGVDNNVGKYVIPPFNVMMPTLEEETNERIARGRYTVVLRLENVGPDDNAKVPGALWLVGERSETTFAADETWPVAGETVLPLQLFADGYMRDGVWVSTDSKSARALVPVPVLGDALVLPLRRAVLSVNVSDGGNGVIAGAILANDLDAALLPSLERRGFCRGNATHAQIASTIHSSVDLLADGSDDARECDAVSVGIGFTMKPIAGLAGTTGSPAPPVTECGTDASAP